MASPEFYTTGAPGSALHIPVDHSLSFEELETVYGPKLRLSSLNKIGFLVSDPIGTEPESKLPIHRIATKVQDVLAAYSTKTELWGVGSIEFLLRKWRECLIDALHIGRIFRVSNNDYSKFANANMEKLMYALTGAAPGQWKVIRDNMPNLMNTYLSLCERLENIPIPYFKQLSEIVDLFANAFVDTDPEKKLPSLAVAIPRIVIRDNYGTTVMNSFYGYAGNTMADMLAHFEENLDMMDSIVVDNKNYASDIKKALAQAYGRSPVKKDFFRELVTKPLAWYSHKMKASQFRNASVINISSLTANLATGILTSTVGATLAPECKAAQDKIVLDLYTDSEWKDTSRAMAAQGLYAPVADLSDNVVSIKAFTGFLIENIFQYAAADTTSDNLSGGMNFVTKWQDSHSSAQDTATKGLRGWLSFAATYSDMPFETAEHHDEVWFTGKIDDFVELTKSQRATMVNLIVACLTQISPAAAVDVVGQKSSTDRGERPSRRGKRKAPKDKEEKKE